MHKLTIQTSPQSRPYPTSPKTMAPLLSQVFIQLPKPQPTKKITNLPEHIDYLQPHKPVDSDSIPNKGESHCFLFSGTKTRNSSASLPFRTESEIISQWVRNLFQKRGLLGPIWQQKLCKRRKQLLRQCFTLIRQYQVKPSSAYLQTQSRYKPPLRTYNQLHVLGLQKLSEIIPRLTLKLYQSSFSKLLRFLAFQHVNKLSKSRQQDNPTFSIDGQQLKQSYHPRIIQGFASREDYQLQNLAKTTRYPHSLKQLPLVQNQYALAPVSPLDHQHEIFTQNQEKVRTPRSSRQLQGRCSHGLTSSRDSVKVYDYQKYQNLVDPRYEMIKMKESQYVYGNPPSPKSHHFTPVMTPHPIFSQPQSQPQYHNHQPTRNEHLNPARHSAHIRPHSHNPFNLSSKSKDLIKSRQDQEQQPQSRSRAVSASPNIKISFMGGLNTRNCQKQKKVMPADYQGQHQQQIKARNAQKLGTQENRKMRQSYQVNSFNNELLPQDYPRTPNAFYSPKAPMYSSPVTPKVMHSPTSKGLYLSPSNPLTPSSHASSPMTHGLGRPSPKVRREPDSNHCSRNENDYNFRRREKLVVTSSRRRY